VPGQLQKILGLIKESTKLPMKKESIQIMTQATDHIQLFLQTQKLHFWKMKDKRKSQDAEEAPLINSNMVNIDQKRWHGKFLPLRMFQQRSTGET
jgi:hypothetical protein